MSRRKKQNFQGGYLSIFRATNGRYIFIIFLANNHISSPLHLSIFPRHFYNVAVNERIQALYLTYPCSRDELHRNHVPSSTLMSTTHHQTHPSIKVPTHKQHSEIFAAYFSLHRPKSRNQEQKMSHDTVYFSRPRTYGKASIGWYIHPFSPKTLTQR
jgi:hypothetical protein